MKDHHNDNESIFTISDTEQPQLGVLCFVVSDGFWAVWRMLNVSNIDMDN